MNGQRKGRQVPTRSFVLPYEETEGAGAVDLYNSTGRAAQEWQELILTDMLATNIDGLWTHSKYGYSLPRRNGKNEVIAMRELYGLMKGEHILHTAHRTTTAHSAWERLMDLTELAGLEIVSSYRAYGKEHIAVNGDGRIEFRTRTSKGGLGEGFDLLIIDEAQEYQDDQESALKYTVTDSKNPQTILTGTPPTPVSSGVVFTKFRKDVLAGLRQNSGWAEWSVDQMTDIHDKEAWYLTNPSLGTVFTERSVTDEMSGDEVDFNIQRLGLWIKHNQRSAISAEEWESLKCAELPKLEKKLYVGIKFGHDGENVAMAVAARADDEKVFVEALDCVPVRNGDDWMLAFLKQSKHLKRVIVDGASRQTILANEMKRNGIKPPLLPTVKQAVEAYGAFEKGIYDKAICHMGQPSLAQIVGNCEKRAIGTSGGFGYRSILEGADVALLDSVALAYWGAVSDTGAGKQTISY